MTSLTGENVAINLSQLKALMCSIHVESGRSGNTQKGMVRIYGKCFADGWILGFLTLSDAIPFDTSC